MIYIIWAFLVKHLWWQRYRLRQALALVLFFIGIRPKSGIMSCGGGDGDLIDCGYFEIKEPRYDYFEVALPLPRNIAIAYLNRRDRNGVRVS